MKRVKKTAIRVLAEHMHVEVEFLERCVEIGALNPEELRDDPFALPPARSARLRRLQRLCRGLELDVFAGSIIVDLLEQLDDLRRELERPRGAGL